MPTYRNPGVYVEEGSISPRTITEVETAIPAFVGYTQKAMKNTVDDLILKPAKIYSLKEYEKYYGYPKDDDIAVTVTAGTSRRFMVASFIEPDLRYLIYYSVKMFFENGGGKCYVISVGTYQSPPVIDLTGDSGSNPATMYGLHDGLDALAREDEPTLIVIPEAINLTAAHYRTLIRSMLRQCNTLRDRFAIIDLYNGRTALDSGALSINRGYFGSNYLKYGAAYYPFVKTTMNYYINEEEINVAVTYGANPAVNLSTLKTSNTALYNFVKDTLKEHFVQLPPSAAVAGAYTATDARHGVWKAPANVSLTNVIEPVIKLDNTEYKDLNIDAVTGKSINIIRTLSGNRTVIWGARTLAGNDNEWRYIPVRRFFNMVEKSVKQSTYWVVFESNDANTWASVRGAIENYLTQKWRSGALAGMKPEDAFFVHCGLGITMTTQDVLRGRMNIVIGMALVRPAEFIILKISLKMPSS